MNARRPLVVWIAMIALFLVLVLQAVTFGMGVFLENWNVKPVQALLMVPSIIALLSLIFSRKWGYEAGIFALGTLLLWQVMTATMFVDQKGLRNSEFVWISVGLWAWLTVAFTFSNRSKSFFAELRARKKRD